MAHKGILRVRRTNHKQWVNDTARSLRAALRKEPHNHWLLTRLSADLYEEGRYAEAASYARKALRQKPNCPLAIWDFACALDMLRWERKAIELWSRLIRLGVPRIAHGTCGEGVAWARALIADSYYRRSLTRRDIGDLRGSTRDMQHFLRLCPISPGRLFHAREGEQALREWKELPLRG